MEVDPASVVRRHIDAFNGHDLDRLMACFSEDATWVAKVYREGSADI